MTWIPGHPLTTPELDAIRRRLSDVLAGDDAVRLLGHVDHLRGILSTMSHTAGPRAASEMRDMAKHALNPNVRPREG